MKISTDAWQSATTYIQAGPWSSPGYQRFAIYNYPELSLDYVAPGAIDYTGQATIKVSGGSKLLIRSLDEGYTWTPVYDNAGNIIPLTETEISNLTSPLYRPESILYREPNSGTTSAYRLGNGDIPQLPTIPRAVTIPSVAGMTLSPGTGVVRVQSGQDLVLTIKVSDITKEPKVTTGRTRPDGEDVTQKYKGDGVYEVTIVNVNSSFNLSIVLVPAATADVEGSSVWSAGGQVYVTAAAAASAEIYGATGALVKTVALGAGETTGVSLPAGFYIVSLNGKAYKVILK
ncbi:MAG: hypothetical protein LBJ23_01080 [Tannerella sp.]|nr:hypothetical protein [Tannerella sp.]